MASLALGMSTIGGVLGVVLRRWIHKSAPGRSLRPPGAGPGGVLAPVGRMIAPTAGPFDELVSGATPLARRVGRFLAGVGTLKSWAARAVSRPVG